MAKSKPKKPLQPLQGSAPDHTIRMVNLDSLTPAPTNPRKISPEAFNGLTSSLAKFGLVQNLVINKRTGHVVGGHQRIAALRALGKTEAPVIEVDLSEAEEQALNITLNNPAIQGQFTDDLQAMLDQLHSATPDLIEGLNLNDLWNGSAYAQGKTDPDEVPPAPATPVTKLGDIYTLGDHRLMCGDSTKDVAVLMNGALVDMVFTSPPYNQGGGGMKYDYYGESKNLYQKKSLDNMTDEEYTKFLTDVLFQISSVVQPDAAVLWNVMYNAKSRDSYGSIIFNKTLPFRVKETIIWDKGNGFPTASRGILSRSSELIFLMCKADKYFTNQGDNEVVWNTWRISNSLSQHEDHHACFPVELPIEGIKYFGKLGGNILDVFGGTGSTLIACEQTKRHGFMMELSPAYCDVIVKRWENFTGRKAERVSA